METIEYKGRKLKAKTTKNTSTGAKHVQVFCNGVFFCRENLMTEREALTMAMLYVDEAEKRPAAYPVLAVPHPVGT